MSSPIKSLVLPVLLSSTVLFSACSKEDQKPESNQSTTVQELGEASIKEFKQNQDDQHDIQLLSEFDERFTQISDDMEDELIALRKEGSLTPEVIQKRQLDIIQTALNMLQELSLKTDQGRYIQELMMKYWQQQAQLTQTQQGPLSEEEEANSAMQGLNDLLHAQEQLESWREQYIP